MQPMQSNLAASIKQEIIYMLWSMCPKWELDEKN